MEQFDVLLVLLELLPDGVKEVMPFWLNPLGEELAY